ncbi:MULTISPECIES: pseudouridine synthase [Vagococcus]|uniref:Pseudouridine synthase n=1 Tax=Vagococcus teuberi TaxID=519472 RepID=A0A1J0A6A5_9ENTE|nr:MULTISPECIES: pseudouridine synthase [Vagococcus]APB31460.1 pseudouridine synthase [Vagococcus teuberi]RHH68191.1 rRNA pseudouridine synthase [Vagococcus sp. AM17-17]
MERLQKVMAHCGVASRRKSEELIQAGRVTVNGKKVTELGVKVSQSDKVEVDGVPIYQEQPVYYLFYKPKNVISAVSDDKDRPVVTDYFHSVPERIFPVGRLDYDTSGLLIMTNDGEFANLLTHPKHEIDKVYVAKVKGIATKEMLKPLRNGIRVDGRKTAPARFKILSTDARKNTSVVELIIHEGRNHQVKNMLAAVDLPVMKLKREKVATLDLFGLNPGDYREMTKKEVSQLYVLANKE